MDNMETRHLYTSQQLRWEYQDSILLIDIPLSNYTISSQLALSNDGEDEATVVWTAEQSVQSSGHV